jgi:sec-independent protein translocase protein TatC
MLYVDELRSSFFRALLIYAVVVLCLMNQSEMILTHLLKPIQTLFPQLVFTHVFTPIFMQIKLAFVSGAFLLLPYWIIELWRYVRSALYPAERMVGLRLLLISGVMFYSGIALGWFFLLPELMHLAQSWSLGFATQLVDVSGALDLVYLILGGSGLLFQLPVLMLALSKLGLINVEQCHKKRRHMVLVSLVVGMMITPPDVMAQVMVAVPLYALFEIGLLLMRWRAPAQSPVVRSKDLSDR